MTKTVHFKTHSLLKNLVGKDLINDDSIAIIELIKNAYDAGSPSVLVRFTSPTPVPLGRRIIIADSGTGMSESDIVDKWLNIAYSEKKNGKLENGAFYAGNKGIGRFSCDRLGQKLDLITRKGKGGLLHLHVDWLAFEREDDKDLTIQKIDVKLSSIQDEIAKNICGVEIGQTGTVLVISELRDEWGREKLLALKQSMERFINPNQMFSANPFEILLDAPAQNRADIGQDYHLRVNGKIQNRVFSSLEFKATYIHARIEEDGSAITTELHHEGEPVFRLTEKNRRYPHLRNINVVIYFLNPYKKAFFKRQTGIRSIDFGSIFFFLNGFRIAPYGERGDDWLGLDSRKTQGVTRYLGNRDVVGRIEVFDNEDRFKPISSREGLKKTSSFVELKDVFFMDVFRKLERFVVDGLGWDSIPEAMKQSIRQDDGMDWHNTKEEYSESWDRKRQRIAFEIVSLIGASRDDVVHFWFNPSLLEGLHQKRGEEVRALIKLVEEYSPAGIEPDLSKNLSLIKEAIERARLDAQEAKTEASQLRVILNEQKNEIKTLKSQAEIYKGETLFLKSVSSLDVKNLIGFHHQILLDATILNNYATKAMRAAKKDVSGKAVIKNLEEVIFANMRIMAVAQYATKAGFKASASKEETDIPSFIEQYVLNVATGYVASGLNVKVENNVVTPFKMKISRIELSIVIDNIISNSVKALARALRVVMEIDKNDVTVRFLDDGSGLDKSIQDISQIFEIGVTTTSGSGIGLYHARQIIEKLGGRLNAFEISPHGFEIRLELTR